MKPTARPSTILDAAGTGGRLRQTIALAICAGICGASVFEAIAAVWLHATSTVPQPTAEPLAALGAALGVTMLLVLRRWPRGGRVLAHTIPEEPGVIALIAETIPLAPMAWQPVPRIVHASGESEPLAPFSPVGSGRNVCRGARVAPHTPGRADHRARPPRRAKAKS
jgi:hypothetical protein